MSRLLDIKIEPVDYGIEVMYVEDVKSYCRVDFCEDDKLFARLIAASRQRIERYTGRVFLLSNCEAIYEQEGCGDRILLSFSDNIKLEDDSIYNDKIVGDSFIKTTDHIVKLKYTAGYEIMPDWIKQAVLMDVAYMYENRGDMSISRGLINSETKEFLMPYVKWSLL